MKTIILIFASVLISVLVDEQPQQSDLETAINNSDFVGFVVYNKNGSTPENPILIATEVFKGDDYYLKLSQVIFDMDVSKEYLLIARKRGAMVSAITYPMTRTEQLSREVLNILNNLPCYDELVEKKYQNSICHKNLEPVCGCDNIEYGNLCFMRKHGIIRFRPGRCPKINDR